MKSPYLLLLLICSAGTYSCSKSTNNITAAKKVYAPVSTVVTTNVTEQPLATITYGYNNKNQYSMIKVERETWTSVITFDYNNDGLVSKAIQSFPPGTYRLAYEFTYQNKQMVSYRVSNGGPFDIFDLKWDASGRQVTRKMKGVPLYALINRFAENGQIIEQSGESSYKFTLTTGAAKGAYHDFPLQPGHIIPVDEDLYLLYYGSMSEISQLVLNGATFNCRNEFNAEGYISRAVINPDRNDRITYNFRYEAREKTN